MRYILIFYFWIICQGIQAQCIDSTRINPYYPGCDRLLYHPVCACGKTYFNECIAVNEAGIRYGYYTDGVCDNFDVYVFPTRLTSGPTGEQLYVYIQFKVQGSFQGNMYIMDMYGKIRWGRIYQVSQPYEKFVIAETAEFPTGLYYLMVTSGNEIKTRKFVAIQMQ